MQFFLSQSSPQARAISFRMTLSKHPSSRSWWAFRPCSPAEMSPEEKTLWDAINTSARSWCQTFLWLQWLLLVHHGEKAKKLSFTVWYPGAQCLKGDAVLQQGAEWSWKRLMLPRQVILHHFFPHHTRTVLAASRLPHAGQPSPCFIFLLICHKHTPEYWLWDPHAHFHVPSLSLLRQMQNCT